MRRSALKWWPEKAEKMRQARLGSHHSPESKEKMRQKKLGKVASAETRQKMRQAQLGRPYSPEAREKNRQARLRQRFPTQMTSIEEFLFTEFKKRRLHFEMHKTMFGRFQPDFVFEDAKLIVQADGDFWHSRSARVVQDFEFNARAVSAGWTVMRFSEAVIKADPPRCARTVARFVRKH